MQQSTYGYRIPETDDMAKGVDGWFSSIEFNWNRMDSHNHDGVNSASLSLNSISPYSNTIVAPQTFVYANVNDSTDRITISSHGWTQTQVDSSTGIPVVLTLVDTITNLSDGTTYYVIVVDSNTIKLATSIANAQAGTAIDLTKVADGEADNTLNPWVVVTADVEWKQTITVPAGVTAVNNYNLKFIASAPAGIANETVYANYKKITSTTYEVYTNDNTAGFTVTYK
jgi:hypothetical protein